MPASANLIALNTVVRREIVRVMRLWVEALVLPVITMALYFVIFGKLIGDRIGTFDGGFSYIQFITPGLVMMKIITISYDNASGSIFFVRFNRSVEEMLLSPMSNWAILLGYVTGSVARGFLVGTVVLLISLLFTSLHIAHPVTAFLSAFFSATIFSLVGFINGLYARTLDDIGRISVFALNPLAFLGGGFYPVAMLNEPWQDMARLNPIMHMISAFRYGILGAGEHDIGMAFAAMLILIVVLSIAALILLDRGVGTRS
ncbi:MAG: ABC transporter permease [Lysobacteraceae bacterium]